MTVRLIISMQDGTQYVQVIRSARSAQMATPTTPRERV